MTLTFELRYILGMLLGLAAFAAGFIGQALV
jgi:hypothetical protein